MYRIFTLFSDTREVLCSFSDLLIIIRPDLKVKYINSKLFHEWISYRSISCLELKIVECVCRERKNENKHYLNIIKLISNRFSSTTNFYWFFFFSEPQNSTEPTLLLTLYIDRDIHHFRKKLTKFASWTWRYSDKYSYLPFNARLPNRNLQ